MMTGKNGIYLVLAMGIFSLIILSCLYLMTDEAQSTGSTAKNALTAEAEMRIGSGAIFIDSVAYNPSKEAAPARLAIIPTFIRRPKPEAIYFKRLILVQLALRKPRVLLLINESSIIGSNGEIILPQNKAHFGYIGKWIGPKFDKTYFSIQLSDSLGDPNSDEIMLGWNPITASYQIVSSNTQ